MAIRPSMLKQLMLVHGALHGKLGMPGHAVGAIQRADNGNGEKCGHGIYPVEVYPVRKKSFIAKLVGFYLKRTAPSMFHIFGSKW